MAKFAIPVATLRDNELVQFAAGDEVPEWADGLVGDHCLVPEDLDLDEDDAEDLPPEPTPEPEPVPEDEKPADPAVPDFTKPRARAPRK